MLRFVVALLAVFVVLPLNTASLLAAPQGSPAAVSRLPDLGLPTLDVTASPGGYEGIPKTLAAGRYLVTLSATKDTGEFGAGVGFVQPVGLSADEFLKAVPRTVVGGPSSAIHGAIMAGGTRSRPGQPTRVVLDLRPGTWIAWGDDPHATQAPTVFEATGKMAADLPEPAADATVTLSEYAVAVSEGVLAAGRHVIRVTNTGAQPHYLMVAQGPDDMTDAQFATAMQEEMEAERAGREPVYSGLNPNVDIPDEGGYFIAEQTGGSSLWAEVDLVPGTYVLVCFYPDRADGLPHAYHGMHTVLRVQ